MKAILLLFGAEPIAYQIIAFAVLAAFVVAAVRSRVHTVTYLLLAALAVFVWRWPAIMYAGSLNPDEGQALANALKAMVDPVPWRSFDPGTAGPLQSEILMLPALLGMHLDFVTARLVAVALVIGSLCAFFWAARWMYGPGVARFALVPPVMFFAGTIDADFTHYSSEHLPFFLSMIALASCAYLAGRREPDRSVLAAACGGFALGCIPFSKLQALPVGFVLLVCLAGAIAVSRRTRSELRRLSVAAVAALLAPAAIILGSVVLSGVWSDFLISYFGASLVYLAGKPAGPDYYFSTSLAFRVLITGSLALSFAGAIFTVVRRPTLTRTEIAGLMSAALLMAGSFFAVYEPHKAFLHYLLFLVFPLCWLLATVAAIVGRVAPARVGRTLGLVYAAPFVLATVVMAIATPNWFVGMLATDAAPVQSGVVAAIERHAPAHAAIVVWGWMPEYYFQSNTIMAPRDAVSFWEIQPGPYRTYYRRRFMTDIAARPPSVIVEAIGPNLPAFKNRASQGIEAFPDLAELVRDRYVLDDTVGEVRVFVLKSRDGAPPVAARPTPPPTGVRDVSAGCRGGAAPQQVNPNGRIELVMDVATVAAVPEGAQLRADAAYGVVGWAIDPSGDRVLASVCMLVDGKPLHNGKALYGYPRPDVAATFTEDRVTASGYSIELPARSLSAGRHELRIVSVTASGSALLLPARRVVTVH